MGFLKKIRISIGKRKLEKARKSIRRNKKLINLKDAESIGIIYKLHDAENYEEIRQFVKKLKAENKNVKTLGYINAKNTPQYWLPSVGFDYITKKSLDFFYIPKTNSAKKFTNEEFDILINLTVEDCLPIDYITGVSIAHFKVGINESRSGIFDFMINTKNGLKHKDYIDQAYYYLNLLNS